MVMVKKNANRAFKSSNFLKGILVTAVILAITNSLIFNAAEKSGGSNESKILSSSSSSAAAAASTEKRRLEFVHITKTGGSAIEKAGAEIGITWGACHYMNITDVGCSNADLNYVAPNYQSYAKTSPWHTPPKILKTQYSDSENPYIGADTFAVVRNPYDRVISEYYCPWVGFQPKFRKNTKHEKDPNDPKIMNYWVKNMVINLEKSLNEYMAIKPEDRPKEQSKGVNEDPYNLAQKHYVNQAEYVFNGDKQVITNIVHYEDLSKEFQEMGKKYGLNLKLPPKETGGTYTNNEKKLTYLDLDEETIAVINRYAAKDFELLGYEMVKKFDKNGNYSKRAKVVKK